MHTAPMADSQGEFAEFKTQPDVPCRKCGVHAVSMREWESSCGGWEDYQYKCHHCGAAPKRCTGGVKCSENARYDEVSHGVYSLTLKCRLCGAIVRHDWD